MIKPKLKSVLSAVLVASAALAMQGCWEEIEPNNDAEEAWGSDQHVQLWSGDWHWPDEGTLPFPNGQGNVSWSDSVDHWSISMWNWVSGETADDVTSFQGTLWLSEDADVSVGWQAWRGGDNEDAIWESVQARQSFCAPKGVAVSTFVFTLDVDTDDRSPLYSLKISGTGTYGFILTPISN